MSRLCYVNIGLEHLNICKTVFLTHPNQRQKILTTTLWGAPVPPPLVSRKPLFIELKKLGRNTHLGLTHCTRP